ncbi:MAG: hypothetical protein ACRDZU_13370 [Acidimicrobiales bacterium]
MAVTVDATADDPKRGMTFGELRRFVQDGMRHDVPDSARVHMVSTWRQTIKKLEVKGELDAPTD